MTDALAAIAWYLITAIMISAAWIAARRAFPVDGVTQRIMHTVVFVWTWIVVVSCVLGTFGALNAVSLGGGVLLAAAGTWFWSKALNQMMVTPNQNQFVNGSGNSPQDLMTSDTTRWSCRVSNAWNVFWTGAAALFCVLVADRALLQFPSDWDTLTYHRPLIDHWLQTGSLYAPQCAVWHVPGNNELLGLWWAAAFSGDFWVGLMNIPAALLLALGTYELGRLVGLTPLLRHATVIAIIGSSIVFLQITNAKNDIAVAGLFIAGLSYGCRYIKYSSWYDLVLAGAALGLTAGVKYYALGYAGVGWLGIVAMAWWKGGRRTAIVVAFSVAGIMLLPSAYWYGRNLIVTGTPLYPQGYSGPDSAEALLPRSAWQSSILGNGRLEVLPEYVDGVWKRGGICQTLAVLMLPLSWTWLLASTQLLAKQPDHPTDRRVLCGGVAITLMGAWLIFGATPFTVDAENNRLLESPYILSRFSQSPIVLSVLAIGLLLSDLSRWINTPCNYARIRSTLSALLPMAFAVAALATLCTSLADVLRDEWLVILLIVTDLVLLSLIVRELLTAARNHDGGIPQIVVFAILAGGMATFVLSTAWLAPWWHGNFSVHYDQRYRTQTFSKIEKWKEPPPTIVALHYRYYPFFGSRRQFHVCRPRRAYSKSFLLIYLASYKADVIAVMHRDPFPFGRYKKSIEWVEEHSEIFKRVDAGADFNLYRIQKDRLRDQIMSQVLM